MTPSIGYRRPKSQFFNESEMAMNEMGESDWSPFRGTDSFVSQCFSLVLNKATDIKLLEVKKGSAEVIKRGYSSVLPFKSSSPLI